MTGLSYLNGNIVDGSVLDARESDDFRNATRDALERDKKHPDNLNDRYEAISQPVMLDGIMKGYSFFKDHSSVWNKESFLRFVDAIAGAYPKSTTLLRVNGAMKSQLKESIRVLIGNEVDSLDMDMVLAKVAPFIELGEALAISNIDTPTSSLVVNGGPIVEMEQRVQDSVHMILAQKPMTIVLSGGATSNVEQTGFSTEAEYLHSQISKDLVGEGDGESAFFLENKSRNTGENMSLVGNAISANPNTKIVTTDYDSLRVLLTAQRQMPYPGVKRVHGSKFQYTQEDGVPRRVWSPYAWWLTEEGWLATMYAVSRLVKYRAKTNPFL